MSGGRPAARPAAAALLLSIALGQTTQGAEPPQPATALPFAPLPLPIPSRRPTGASGGPPVTAAPGADGGRASTPTVGPPESPTEAPPEAAGSSGPQPAAPSPADITTVRGVATWYRWRPGEAAAGPALRAALGPGWRGRSVSACSAGRCVRVVLSDWCACAPRGGRPTLLDLDRRSFAALAAPSRGVVEVAVSW